MEIHSDKTQFKTHTLHVTIEETDKPQSNGTQQPRQTQQILAVQSAQKKLSKRQQRKISTTQIHNNTEHHTHMQQRKYKHENNTFKTHSQTSETHESNQQHTTE
jgi:hypothetical protein